MVLGDDIERTCAVGTRMESGVDAMDQITGYEYEVRACIRAMQEGTIECSEMPHAEILQIMRQMDDIRKQLGVVYPFD
jgi:hypothetical protein